MISSPKVILVTGGSSGLGWAMCQRLAALGHHVTGTGRKPDKSPSGWQLIAMDVTDDASVERAVDEVISKHQRIDVLVNNAGIMPMAPMSALKVDEWDKMIDVNVKGVLYGVASVLPTMKAQKSGHIINLSSVAGLKVSGGVGTVYSATKFAVKAISEGLRMEVAGDNIRVTTLYPGAVASELKFGSSDSASSQAMQAFYEANEIPADSVARAVAYAVEQPDDVAVNEITIRPTRQEF